MEYCSECRAVEKGFKVVFDEDGIEYFECNECGYPDSRCIMQTDLVEFEK